MEKLADFWKLFKQGEAVSNADAWTTGQITANAIGGVLCAAVKLLCDFGVALPIDAAQCTAIGVGALAVANIGMSIIKSKSHGLPSSSGSTALPKIES